MPRLIVSFLCAYDKDGDSADAASKRCPWIVIEECVTKKNSDEKWVHYMYCTDGDVTFTNNRPVKRRKVDDAYSQAILHFHTGAA